MKLESTALGVLMVLELVAVVVEGEVSDLSKTLRDMTVAILCCEMCDDQQSIGIPGWCRKQLTFVVDNTEEYARWNGMQLLSSCVTLKLRFLF